MTMTDHWQPRAVLLAALLACAGSLCAADPPAAAAALPDPEQAVTGDYVLYPGDLVEIRVFDHPDLTTSVRVPNRGAMSFPLIGVIEPVAGRSINQITGEIAERLRAGYVRDATVSANLAQFGARRVYVMGAVQRPAALELNPFARMTAVQAVSSAGGFTPEADRRGAQVVRAATATGELAVFPVPADDRSGALAEDVVLEPGDTVIVPRLDRIFILGQVANPGALTVSTQEPLTVSKAVSLAGGFERFAKQSKVQVVRAGKVVVTVDVRKVLSGDAGAGDPPLQPGDTVYVPESRF